MSHILYILPANYDRKHLENSKIGLDFFYSKRVGTLTKLGVNSKRLEESECQ